MSDYKIAAIPTVYRGRQYRSRLEAKWAAFFDLIGWRHEYEPFDLGSWSPDFLIHCAGGRRLLVEVKPLQEFDPAVATKVFDACVALGQHKTPTRVLIVGTNPQELRGTPQDARVVRYLRLGWMSPLAVLTFTDRSDGSAPDVDWAPANEWREARLAWLPLNARPGLVPDVLAQAVDCPTDGRGKVVWDNAIGGAGANRRAPQFYPEHGSALWAEATNAVQWRGVAAQP